MIINIKNLNQEEKEMIYTFEEENPECFVREIEASLDGVSLLQIVIQTIVPALATILAAFIAKNNVNIIVIMENKEFELGTVDDLYKLVNQLSNDKEKKTDNLEKEQEKNV